MAFSNSSKFGTIPNFSVFLCMFFFHGIRILLRIVNGRQNSTILGEKSSRNFFFSRDVQRLSQF